MAKPEAPNARGAIVEQRDGLTYGEAARQSQQLAAFCDAVICRRRQDCRARSHIRSRRDMLV